MKKLLVEKYRPMKIDGYVFQNEDTKLKVEKWVSEGVIPNILLTGSPGCGKSTLAGILVNELGIQDVDVKRINASLQNGVGFLREELEPWMKRMHFGKFKVVVLEECDRMTQAGQLALRDLTESFSDDVRFILTANYPKQIIPALHSRFQHIEMGEVNLDGILDLVCTIIEGEGITFEEDADLMSHVEAYAPDIRKIINSIDEHTDVNKVLKKPSRISKSTDIDQWEDYFSRHGKLNVDEALKLTEGVDASNYELYYEAMYNNLQKFKDAGSALILISQYLDRAQRCANQRLHLDALLYHIAAEGDIDE